MILTQTKYLPFWDDSQQKAKKRAMYLSER